MVDHRHAALATLLLASACNPYTDKLPPPKCRTHLDCGSEMMCRSGRCGLHGRFSGRLYFRYGRGKALRALKLEVVRRRRVPRHARQREAAGGTVGTVAVTDDGRRFEGTGVGRGTYVLRARCLQSGRVAGATGFEVGPKGIGRVRGAQGVGREEIRLAVNETLCRGRHAARRVGALPRRSEESGRFRARKSARAGAPGPTPSSARGR